MTKGSDTVLVRWEIPGKLRGGEWRAVLYLGKPFRCVKNGLWQEQRPETGAQAKMVVCSSSLMADWKGPMSDTFWIFFSVYLFVLEL